MTYKKLTESTSKELKMMLPSLMKKMEELKQDPPQQIVLAWPLIVGEKWAPMTKAVSFIDGVLLVKVKNSSLLSILSQHEKQRLLQSLKEKFPSWSIQEIRFCMG